MEDNNISHVIWTVGGNKKFFDMRNGLQLAYVKDYAMLYGKGGKKHAPRGGIIFSITDYSGSKSQFAKATVPISLIYKIKVICEKNFGTDHNGVAEVASGVTYAIGKVDNMSNAFIKFCNFAIGACHRLLTGTSKGTVAEIGNSLTEANKILMTNAPANPIPVREPYTEVVYHQERVNVYKHDPNDNFVPVSSCDVSRTQYRKDGSLSKLPWNITIKNFWAQPNNQRNGTTSYNARNVRDLVNVNINISDDDMYHAVILAEHFIRNWETAYCVNLIIQGMNASRYNNNNNNNNNQYN